MSRKVYIELRVRLIVNADDGIDLDTVLSDMDYDFTSATEGANIEETEITDWQVIDSK